MRQDILVRKVLGERLVHKEPQVLKVPQELRAQQARKVHKAH